MKNSPVNVENKIISACDKCYCKILSKVDFDLIMRIEDSIYSGLRSILIDRGNIADQIYDEIKYGSRK